MSGNSHSWRSIHHSVECLDLRLCFQQRRRRMKPLHEGEEVLWVEVVNINDGEDWSWDGDIEGILDVTL